MIAVDIETTIEARPKLAVVAVGTADGELHIEHTRGSRPSVQMTELLASDDWITQNGTNFDLRVLHDHGVPFPVNHYDTLIGESVLLTNGRSDLRKDLASIQKRRLGKVTKGTADHGSWMQEALSEVQLSYIREDVLPLFAIKAKQEAEAARRGLDRALYNEQRVSRIVAEMVYNGMPIQLDRLEEHKQQCYDAYIVAEERLRSKYGPKFNARSHVQIKNALPDLQLKDTKADTLNQYIWHPDVADILTVKVNKRTYTMYNNAWVADYVYDGAVHASFWPTGTDTVRFSSSSPNVQQIPRNLRPVFGGPPGTVMIKIDANQLEARIMAGVSGDQRMLQDALERVDVPHWLAEQCFDIAPVPRDLRDLCKKALHAWNYSGGANAEGGVYNLIHAQFPDIVQKDTTLFAALNRRYRGVSAYRAKVKGRFRNRTPIHLPWGHIRTLSPSATLPAAVASEPQSAGSIGLKEGLLLLHAEGLTRFLAAVIHDEVVLGPMSPEDAEWVAPIFKRCIVDGMQTMIAEVADFPVPIDVTVDIDERWTH